MYVASLQACLFRSMSTSAKPRKKRACLQQALHCLQCASQLERQLCQSGTNRYENGVKYSDCLDERVPYTGTKQRRAEDVGIPVAYGEEGLPRLVDMVLDDEVSESLCGTYCTEKQQLYPPH